MGAGTRDWRVAEGALCFLAHMKTNTFTNQAPDVNPGSAQLASRLHV